MCFTEQVTAEGVKGIHRLVHQVAPNAPHIAEEEDGADEGVELLHRQGEVHSALRTDEEGLEEGAQGLDPAHGELGGRGEGQGGREGGTGEGGGGEGGRERVGRREGGGREGGRGE